MPGSNRSSAPRACARTTANASFTRPARAIPISFGCGPGRRTARPTRSCTRAGTSRSPRCSRPAPRRGWRSFRSAAARAWSAASTPLRGRHEAVVALELRRPGRAGRPGPGVARRRRSRRGMRAPELERALAPHGLTLGHFPQSLRVRRRSAAASRRARPARPRPDTARSRRWCSACGSRRRPPRSRCRPCRRPRPGPSCAGCSSARRGRSGVITEVALPSPPGAGRARLRGRLLRGFRRRPGGASLAGAGARASRRRAPLRRGRDPDVAGARGRRRPESAGSGAPTSARAATRQDAWRSCGFEGDAHEVPARRRRARRLVRRAGGLPLGSSPGEAWATDASRRLTCATSCSASA